MVTLGIIALILKIIVSSVAGWFYSRKLLRWMKRKKRKPPFNG